MILAVGEYVYTRRCALAAIDLNFIIIPIYGLDDFPCCVVVATWTVYYERMKTGRR